MKLVYDMLYCEIFEIYIIFPQQMINQQMHLEEVFEKLQCHIQNNIIKVGKIFSLKHFL